jgi:hypothetical protein
LNLLKDKVYLETMKRVGKIAIWLAGGLVLSAGARADNVASADNPYMPIVTRNIFSLNAAPTNEPTGDAPPKITLSGIMSTFDKAQALFKVAGTGKSGQPAKDQSYILSEGQRQDDIEVRHIDQKTGLVTFNNHGTVQEIPLASAPAITTPGPGPGGPGPGGQIPRPNFGGRTMGGPGGNVAGNGGRYGLAAPGGQNNGMGNNANPNLNPSGMGGGSTMQSIPTGTGYTGQQQTQNAATTEAQAVAAAINTEAQRQLWESQGNPAYKIIPPTMLTHSLKSQAQ